MKKLTLPFLFATLALVLTSCVLVELPDSSFHFDSNWQRSNSGAFVFCSNKTTQMRYSFRIPVGATIQKVTETYKGKASGETLVLDRPVSQLSQEGDRYYFVGQINFGQGLVPQTLQPEVGVLSIVVTPFPPTITPSIVGSTTVRVRVDTTTGSLYGVYTYDVYANCP